jgi:hypothetical protein
MLAICHNIYRLLFVTCRDKGSADKCVQGICYCCPARQSLESGVRCDGSDLTFFWVRLKYISHQSQEILRFCINDRNCYSQFDKCLSCILKHDQQDATLYNTLYFCQHSTCFKRVFRSSSGAQICTCRVAELGLSPNSSTLAVTANKFDKYLMLLVQIWAPDDERKNRLKHVQRWQ